MSAQQVLLENFEEVTPPALPTGWVATNAQGHDPLWMTSASANSYTPSNSAFVVGGMNLDERLESPSVSIATSSAQLRFQHAFAFADDPGAHPEDIPLGGGTLEISIAGGAFQNILSAGGSFVVGGYNAGNGWISQNSFPPACCTAVIVNLPAAAAGTNIVIRWHMTTGGQGPDISGGGEWWVDAVQICDGGPCDPLPKPVKTDVDPTGNGVWEPGETVNVEPSYFNNLNAAFDLSGTATGLTGPPGATYTITDSTANYGSIDPGTAAGCAATADCYSISVTNPATRPAAHWDALFTEELAGGFSLTRTLHIGSSFPDVPTTNPFYAYIENLFHNGVTGGCAGSNYCPDSPVTRAQTAVFLLKAEHGGAYLPPSCSATLFTDEPCPGGLFVDWVNQLASEGITGGCGGGNFCPTNPVTRGQMSVFLWKGGRPNGEFKPPAPCQATIFTDVVCPGAQFVDYINQLSLEGITGGCGGGMFCPANPNTRGQMAVFLVKTFGFQLYAP